MGPVCLDLTRSARRSTRGPATGIDRVEHAYARHFLNSTAQPFGLVGTRLGYWLLNRTGVEALIGICSGDAVADKADVLAPLRGVAIAPGVATRLGQIAVARAPRWGLRAMLVRHLPPGTRYINVGHTNLSTRVFGALPCGADPLVMIHDVIPLTHPQFVRPAVRAKFDERLRATMTGAAHLVVPSSATADALDGAMPDRPGPPVTVAPLAPAQPVFKRVSPQPGDRPVFVVLGTVEARKNHEFLLDIWDDWAAGTGTSDCPELHIVGRRGWAPKALFERIASAQARGHVHYHDAMDDAALCPLLSRATGLLFPSLAEGFGLPAVEAAAAGLPMIVSDIPVFHEVLGEIPVYADPRDHYAWRKAITAMMALEKQRAEQTETPKVPRWTWDAHFKTVLSALG